MKSFRHYIPILKGKDGELRALKDLRAEVRTTVTPFIDVPRVKLKFNPGDEVGVPSESLSSHLQKIANKLGKLWGAEKPILIDLYDLDLDLRTEDDSHPVTFLFDRLKAKEVTGIPVTGLDRDDPYNEAVAAICRADGRGVCLRVLTADLENAAELETQIEGLLDVLGLEPSQADIIFDLRDVEASDILVSVELVIQAASRVSSIKSWRSFTVAGSGFPQGLSLPPLSVTRIPRTEWTIWSALIARRSELDRLPAFGDYGIVHPDSVDMDYRKVTLGGKIRYTLPNEWLIVRGYSFKKDEGYGQYHSLADTLRNHAEFMGPEFSWGDQFVCDCADRLASKGSLPYWVRVDTNHHITLVASQLASIDVT